MLTQGNDNLRLILGISEEYAGPEEPRHLSDLLVTGTSGPQDISLFLSVLLLPALADRGTASGLLRKSTLPLCNSHY